MSRLLWRGSLAVPAADLELHGLAIVAQSFQVATPAAVGNIQDPFDGSNGDDEHANYIKKYDTMLQELSLDLEMLRNRSMAVIKSRVKIQVADSRPGQAAAEAEAKPHGRKALKQSIEMLRKGKSQSLLFSKHDSSQDVVRLHAFDNDEIPSRDPRLYIDSRCSSTLVWIRESFCAQPVDPTTGKTTHAVLIALNTEDTLADPDNNTLAIYGQMQPDQHSTRSVLRLHIARIKSKRDLLPRPDDPAPRESLFTQKLRRSSSTSDLSIPPPPRLADSAFTKAGPPGKGRLRAALSSSALPKRDGVAIGTLKKSKSAAALHTTQGGGKTHSQSPSKARNLFGLSSTNSQGATAKSLKRPSTSSTLSRGPLKNGPKRPRFTASSLKRLQEEAEGTEESVLSIGFPEQDEIDPDELLNARLSVDECASPTASIASRRSSTTLAESLVGPTQPRNKSVGRSMSLTRSASMPPAQAANHEAHLTAINANRQRLARSASVVASENAGSDNGDANILTMNKGTLRKVLLNAMTQRSCGREHPDFADVFGVTYKGMQCALRHNIALDRLGKEEITECARLHLNMYLPSG